MGPYGHGDVTHEEPEGDERHEVVELVGSVHDETQRHHQAVVTEQHLKHAEWCVSRRTSRRPSRAGQ